MDSVFDMCLNYLSYCSRTEKEMRNYLKRKSIRKDLIEEVIEKLKFYNYINDENYIKLFIDNNKINKKDSKYKVRYDLKKKGISDNLLELVNELFSDDDEEFFCSYHFTKVEKRTEGNPYKKRINKITAYLNRKGFSYDLIQPLLLNIKKDDAIEMVEFRKHLNHYNKLYSRKNLSQKEKRNKIIKALLQRGYSYSLIEEELENLETEEDSI